MRYVCKQDLCLEKYDDDGGSTEEFINIEAGEVFEASEDKYRIAGGPETIHLENGRSWLEILPETLDMFFEPEKG